MKKQIFSWLGAIIFVGVVVLGYRYVTKIEIPQVGADGRFSGQYSIESVMALARPYVCTFKKVDGATIVAGQIRTDGKKVHGEFRIKTDLLKDEFNSFLIMADNSAYTWTSLAPFGYKSSVAKSASTNATPREQSQIVGTRDKIEYKCEPWVVDETIFTPPSSVTFSEAR